MNHKLTAFLIIGIVCIFGCTQSVEETEANTENKPSGPNYASSQTKQIIERMIQAHGGMEKWQKALSVSLQLHIINFNKQLTLFNSFTFLKVYFSNSS